MIGIANAFSGGIFLCVALLHLLPESTEIFNEYFEQRAINLIRNLNITNQGGNNSVSETESNLNEPQEIKKFPISFLLAFIGYTIILMIEKIIFDTHEHLEGDDDDEEKDPYPLFELKEEVYNPENDESIKISNQVSLETICNIPNDKSESLLKSASTNRNSINREFNSGQSNKTKNYKKSGYNLTINTNLNISDNIIQEEKTPKNHLNMQPSLNQINAEKENVINSLNMKTAPMTTTARKPNLRFGTQIYRAGDLPLNDGRYPLRSEHPSKLGSISIYSKAKRDRINSYLESFKVDSVDKKEQDFKNLFSAAGKMSCILITNDSKIS
jgi:hypothetical protein